MQKLKMKMIIIIILTILMAVQLVTASPDVTIHNPEDELITTDNNITFNASGNNTADNKNVSLVLIPNDMENRLINWLRMDDLDSMNHPTAIIGNGARKKNDAVQTDDGYIGKAFTFDGSDDYLQITTFTSSLNITIASWIYINESNNKLQALCGNNKNDEVTDAIYFSSDGVDGKAIMYNSAGVNFRPVISGLKDNVWHYITFVGNTTHLKFYLNGELKHTGSFTPSIIINSIGKNNNIPTDDFNGSIDDFMIFNKALSEEEIRALYINKTNKNLTLDVDLIRGKNHFVAYAQDIDGNLISKKVTVTREVDYEAITLKKYINPIYNVSIEKNYVKNSTIISIYKWFKRVIL